MKNKIIKSVVLIVTIISSFLLGMTQVKTEIKTVTETEIVTETETVEIIPYGYINTRNEDFINNYVDMRNVVDFEATETGLLIHLNDGSGYYWER